MNPSLRKFLLAGNGGLSGGGAGTGVGRDKLRGWGTQNNELSYYTATYPFNNLVRHGEYWETFASGASRDDTTGWIKNLPNNGTAQFFLLEANGDSFFPKGNYRVHSAIPGIKCTIGGTGLSSVVQGTNSALDATFTIADSGLGMSGYTVALNVVVTNVSGSTITDMDDLYIGLDSSMALYYAGDEAENIFDPTYLAALDGVASIRFMDWMGRSRKNDRLDKAIPTEANCLWRAVEYAYKSWMMPPSVCAKLCKYLDAVCWVNLPTGKDGRHLYEYNHTTNTFTNYLYVSSSEGGADFPQPGPHGFSENDIIGFDSYNEVGPPGFMFWTRYYVHVLSSSTYQLATTPSGTPVVGTSSVLWYGIGGDPYPNTLNPVIDPQTRYDEIAAQCFAAWPEGTFCVEVGNECWNPDYTWPFFQRVAGFIADSPQLTSGPGTYVANAGAAYGHYALKAWKAFETLFPRDQVVRMLCGQNHPTYHTFIMQALGMNDENGVVAAAGTSMKSIADGFALAFYVGQQRYWSDLYNLGAASWTMAQWRDEVVSACQVTTSDGYVGAVNEKAAVFAIAPNLKFYCYESAYNGEWDLRYPDWDPALTGPHAKAVGDRFITFLSSPEAADYIAAVNSAFNTIGFENIQYWNGGNMVSTEPKGKFFTSKKTDRYANTPLETALKAWVAP